MFVIMRKAACVPVLALAFVLVSVLGCTRDDSNAGETDNNDGSQQLESGDDAGSNHGGDSGSHDSVLPGAVTVAAIQDPNHADHPSEDSQILLDNVVALSPRGLITRSCLFGMWVGDPQGGEHSGILIVSRGSKQGDEPDAQCSGSLIPEDVRPGDLFRIGGKYVEYCYQQGDTPCPVTYAEIEASDIEPAGRDAQVPPASEVDAASIAQTGDATDKYEGVLVVVKNVDVTSPSDNHGNWEVTGGLQVHDMFRYSYRPSVGDHIDSLTGLLYFSYDRWKLEPRTDADIVVEGGSDIGGGDGHDAGVPSDDDGGGSAATEPVTATVKALQNVDDEHHPAEGSIVTLEGVVATTPRGIIANRSCLFGVWVADPAGGEHSGILVVGNGTRPQEGGECEGGPIPADVAPGDVFTVQGKYTEYCYQSGDEPCPVTYSELADPVLERTGTGAAVPEPLEVDPAAIATTSDTTARYEGVLVTVRNVEVVTEANQYGEWEVTGGLQVHDVFRYDYTPAVGTSFDSLTGVLYYSFGRWKLEPRSLDDIVEAVSPSDSGEPSDN